MTDLPNLPQPWEPDFLRVFIDESRRRGQDRIRVDVDTLEMIADRIGLLQTVAAAADVVSHEYGRGGQLRPDMEALGEALDDLLGVSLPPRQFPVTDDMLDAPDGAVIEVDGVAYERAGDEWRRMTTETQEEQ